MEKLRTKLKNRDQGCKNRGSGLVLVVVAVAFIGILVGSLLTAVGYAYRLKLYDYNAKDNFYYLEQAMDEVYSGVGNTTLACMQTAYTDVINQMVEYSSDTKNYITKDSKELNKIFKKNFMKNVAGSDFLKNDNLDNFLRSFITNSDVVLESGHAKIVKYIMDPETGVESVAGPVIDESTVEYSTIVIKNVMLSRTANYNRSQAKGDFTQTISTDIVISQPDFEMSFSSLNMNYSTLYDYAMIADNGIEFLQNKSEISVSGNVYAAADFYDKGYNNYDGKITNARKYFGYGYGTEIGTNSYYGRVRDKDGKLVDLSAGQKVSTREIPSVVKFEDKDTVYYNYQNAAVTNKVSTSLRNTRLNALNIVEPYDGVSETSQYSGLYIKGANVNMQASELLVPGTIAIMDGGRFSLYGKTGSNIGEADVWADNVVLGGSSTAERAPYALLRANMHVRDDLELNANYSFFQLTGRYYGFGDGTKADAREYVPSVTGDAANAYFYKETVNGKETLKARGHYNSSAIVINGQNSKLNLSELDALFLGGRSYIQLSKDYGDVERPRAVEITDEEGQTTTTIENVIVKDYIYNGNTDDFKTGESVSIKTNQLAYVPVNITGATTANIEEKTKDDGSVYYLIGLPAEVQSAVPFQEILGAGTALKKVPCIKYTTSDGSEYYYDFQTIFEQNYGTGKTINYNYQYQASPTASLQLVGSGDININSADELAKQFIIAYYTELTNYSATSCRDSLKDITNKYEGFDFDSGYLQIPTQATKIYSSGAITAKSGTQFTIEAKENLQNSLTGVNAISGQESEYDKMISSTSTAVNAINVADNMEDRYAYVKWALENYNSELDSSKAELWALGNIGANGDYASLTPINRYLNYINIDAATDLHPGLTGVSGGQTLNLSSGYKVWISNSDVVVSTDRADGVVQGIVITKGNVFFDNTVSKFEGLIVSGDKIFVDNLVGSALPTGRGRSASGNKVITSISASPEVVRAILNECMMITGDTNYGAQARKVLSLFKSYENEANGTGKTKTLDLSFKTIDTIQYSDVVRYANWMKNVVKKETTTTSP